MSGSAQASNGNGWKALAVRREALAWLLAAVLGIAAWQWQWQQTATQHGGAPAGHAARWHDDDD